MTERSSSSDRPQPGGDAKPAWPGAQPASEPAPSQAFTSATGAERKAGGTPASSTTPDAGSGAAGRGSVADQVGRDGDQSSAEPEDRDSTGSPSGGTSGRSGAGQPPILGRPPGWKRADETGDASESGQPGQPVPGDAMPGGTGKGPVYMHVLPIKRKKRKRFQTWKPETIGQWIALSSIGLMAVLMIVAGLVAAYVFAVPALKSKPPPSPEIVARDFLDAAFQKRDLDAAANYACADSQAIDEAQKVLDDVESREQDTGAQLRVITGDPAKSKSATALPKGQVLLVSEVEEEQADVGGPGGSVDPLGKWKITMEKRSEKWKVCELETGLF